MVIIGRTKGASSTAGRSLTVSCLAGGARRSLRRRRWNVRVEAEEVLRVVLLLQGRQPLVRLGTVGVLHPRVLAGIQVVHVDRLFRGGLQGLPAVTYPLHVPL